MRRDLVLLELLVSTDHGGGGRDVAILEVRVAFASDRCRASTLVFLRVAAALRTGAGGGQSASSSALFCGEEVLRLDEVRGERSRSSKAEVASG